MDLFKQATEWSISVAATDKVLCASCCFQATEVAGPCGCWVAWGVLLDLGSPGLDSIDFMNRKKWKQASVHIPSCLVCCHCCLAPACCRSGESLKQFLERESVTLSWRSKCIQFTFHVSRSLVCHLLSVDQLIETSTTKSVFFWYPFQSDVHLFFKVRMAFTSTKYWEKSSSRDGDFLFAIRDE